MKYILLKLPKVVLLYIRKLQADVVLDLLKPTHHRGRADMFS
jgi:hypothetical protein